MLAWTVGKEIAERLGQPVRRFRFLQSERCGQAYRRTTSWSLDKFPDGREPRRSRRRKAYFRAWDCHSEKVSNVENSLIHAVTLGNRVKVANERQERDSFCSGSASRVANGECIGGACFKKPCDLKGLSLSHQKIVIACRPKAAGGMMIASCATNPQSFDNLYYGKYNGSIRLVLQLIRRRPLWPKSGIPMTCRHRTVRHPAAMCGTIPDNRAGWSCS